MYDGRSISVKTDKPRPEFSSTDFIYAMFSVFFCFFDFSTRSPPLRYVYPTRSTRLRTPFGGRTIFRGHWPARSPTFSLFRRTFKRTKFAYVETTTTKLSRKRLVKAKRIFVGVSRVLGNERSRFTPVILCGRLHTAPGAFVFVVRLPYTTIIDRYLLCCSTDTVKTAVPSYFYFIRYTSNRHDQFSDPAGP